MALDLEAIRKKLNQISGQNSRKNALWKPEKDKSYTIRILPYPNNDGQPFKERWFYYGLGNNSFLTLHQFGKADPVQEFIDSLMNESRNADSKEAGKAAFDMAKTLFPKVRHYAPIIVRGEEDKGVRLWAFGKQTCEDLLKKMLDEDYGDITDIEAGNDIKVTASQKSGQKWITTEVDVRPKKSALSDDSKAVERWLDNIPALDELYELKTYEQLEKALKDHINGGSEQESEGVTRGRSESTGVDFDEETAESKIDDIFNAIAAE